MESLRLIYAALGAGLALGFVVGGIAFAVGVSLSRSGRKGVI